MTFTEVLVQQLTGFISNPLNFAVLMYAMIASMLAHAYCQAMKGYKAWTERRQR